MHHDLEVKPFYWPPFIWGAGQRKQKGWDIYHIFGALYVLNSPQKQSSHMNRKTPPPPPKGTSLWKERGKIKVVWLNMFLRQRWSVGRSEKSTRTFFFTCLHIIVCLILLIICLPPKKYLTNKRNRILKH